MAECDRCCLRWCKVSRFCDHAQVPVTMPSGNPRSIAQGSVQTVGARIRADPAWRKDVACFCDDPGLRVLSLDCSGCGCYGFAQGQEFVALGGMRRVLSQPDRQLGA